MKKKLPFSKDDNEGRSVKVSASVDNDGPELNTWKEQRHKSVQKPKETVQLSLFNRFPYWEDESDVEDDNNDTDGSDDENNSDQLTSSPKVVLNKWRVVKCQSKKQRDMKNKKHYKSFETQNSFHVFQQHTEDDIEMIANGTSPIKSEITT